MNRMGLGLAVGAGYLLGRTRKLKMAVAVGSLVAGKRLNLTPKGIADLVSQQLRDNPQFKEIGDQLRQDLRGVGKAASGAMVERQIDALANRLHGRTAEVRDQLAGAVPGKGGKREQDDELEADEEYDEEYDEEPQDARDDEGEDEEPRDYSDDEDEYEEDEEEDEEPPRKTAAKKTAKKASAKKAPAKKAPAKKAPARRTAAKKTASAGKTAAKTASRPASGGGSGARRSKGGGDR
ncbi:DNA primase [Streptomyces sp. IBSBF 2806]|uniref:DNA primase n=1 Tax=Streptomyces sp. IBSBF 2806 TaxID=2903529 RepID=UPI002FDC1C09